MLPSHESLPALLSSVTSVGALIMQGLKRSVSIMEQCSVRGDFRLWVEKMCARLGRVGGSSVDTDAFCASVSSVESLGMGAHHDLVGF